MPWRLGLVRLTEGVSLVVHLDARCRPGALAASSSRPCSTAPARPRWSAKPADATRRLADEPKLRDMTSDPRFRKGAGHRRQVAGRPGRRESGAEAGADLVWAGHCEPWKNPPGWPAIAELPKTTLVPLDVTDTKIGQRACRRTRLQGRHRDQHTPSITAPSACSAAPGVETARAEMETNCFGLLRLAQAFGPVMQARGADGAASAVAWVNLLSIYALSNYPQQATYSASMAAALSVSQALRAEMRHAGIRVINMFPGPIDDEWNQLLLPPKLAPRRSPAPSSARSRDRSRTSIPAISRRTGLPASATIRRRWNGSSADEAA